MVLEISDEFFCPFIFAVSECRAYGISESISGYGIVFEQNLLFESLAIEQEGASGKVLTSLIDLRDTVVQGCEVKRTNFRRQKPAAFMLNEVLEFVEMRLFSRISQCAIGEIINCNRGL